ncbi:D(1) dopamine receptor [Engraulis encrasicolus]|uniref:D(1) dopamine receptor n=1 Tax=Engraulis encrasicolus TaxID=184585 RepID=UPI002FCF1AA2
MDENMTTVVDNGHLERDPSSRVLTGCFLSLLILSTLLGNTLVCAAVTKFRHLRSKVTNFFVISLAVSDLLVAVLVMPWKAVTEIAGFWPFGAFCDVWVAFDIMCSTASILNLCVISVDRYWAISSPFRYERKMTPRVACVMISTAWTLSVLISFIPVQLNWHKAASAASAAQYHHLNHLQHQQHHQSPLLPTSSSATMASVMTGTNASTSTGHPSAGSSPTSVVAAASVNCDSSLNRTYAISSSLVSFYIPVAIMLATYTQIYRIAQQQIRRISALERAAESAKQRHDSMGGGSTTASESDATSSSSFKLSFKRETKVLKTLSVIMGVFVCCWLPFFVVNCMVPFCDFACVSPTTFDIFVWFGWANSSLNPIIYAFNADFRKAFAVLLGCQRFCPGNGGVETASLNKT